MTTLPRELRKQLEKAVLAARKAAEEGVDKELIRLGVADPAAPPSSDVAQRDLRCRLRTHARQLGDAFSGAQPSPSHLIAACAYHHWHRLLFARFLAENHLLIELQSGAPISLAECRDLAQSSHRDWADLAGDFARAMLPRIFPADDIALELTLPPENRQQLEQILAALPAAIFTADDSLGWVYQFWQAEAKKRVGKSEAKMGADEIPAYTQLFTEDYIVEFLLHNTLGAWWAAKCRAQGRYRELPGVEWTYLRLNGDGTPAAGDFAQWPRAAKGIRLLDPCMGSGHFLVFALPLLAAMRQAEEGLSEPGAIRAVLAENLFGLEIDPRCTELAAFNLALAAWKRTGLGPLPAFNLACSGLAPARSQDDWLALANGDPFLRDTLKKLHALFSEAPILGSLVDPIAVHGSLFRQELDRARPLLEQALAREASLPERRESAVAARGLLAASQILAADFTLVVTNVPYLGRGKQAPELKQFCEDHHPDAKSDLATCMLQRALALCGPGATAALVTPQNWSFLVSYKSLRKSLLTQAQWNFFARLGEHGFDSPQAAGAFTALVALTNAKPAPAHTFPAWDASDSPNPAAKAQALQARSAQLLGQVTQIGNPDARVALTSSPAMARLETTARCLAGIMNGDSPLYQRQFWELPDRREGWEYQQTTTDRSQHFAGLEKLIYYDGEAGHLRAAQAFRDEQLHNSDERGRAAWGRTGLAISQMRGLPWALYTGEKFDSNVAVVLPAEPRCLEAIAAFAASPDLRTAVRDLDQKLNVTNSTIAKVPFDLAHWQKVAAEKYPNGLPKPHSDDPTQWLFNGHPKGSDAPLQVAVARLLGYCWPRQTGSSFMDCPAITEPDGLEPFAADGIACLAPLANQKPAADRLHNLLAAAYGPDWSPAKLNALLAGAASLDAWLRESFFAEHCKLFHQRPFIWHIWDGLTDGFHALVNYHKLAGENGDGNRTLNNLTYHHLGEWIARQQAAAKASAPGADGRLAAALHLQSELKNILAGEPPYDLFIRWKPLAQQPIGWQPDINDGVRLNIRPFLAAHPLDAKAKNASILRVRPTSLNWGKDRGKEPLREKKDFPWFWSWDGKSSDFAGGPIFDGYRWNDLHYSIAAKQAARAKVAVAAKP